MMGALRVMPALGPGQRHGLLAKQLVQRGQPLRMDPREQVLARGRHPASIGSTRAPAPGPPHSPLAFAALSLFSSSLAAPWPPALGTVVLADAILTPTREPSLLSSQIQQGPGHLRSQPSSDIDQQQHEIVRPFERAEAPDTEYTDTAAETEDPLTAPPIGEEAAKQVSNSRENPRQAKGPRDRTGMKPLRHGVCDLVCHHDLIADDAKAPHGEDGPELIRAQGCAKSKLSNLDRLLRMRSECPGDRLRPERYGADVGWMPPVQQRAQWTDAKENDQPIDIQRMTPAEARDKPGVEGIEEKGAEKRTPR